MHQSVDPFADPVGGRNEAPAPERPFRSASQQQVLDEVTQALAQGSGISVLTGEAGLGKTLLVRRALAGRQDPIRVLTASGPDARAAILAMEDAKEPGILVLDDAHEIPEALLSRLGAWPALPVHVMLVGRPDLWTRLRDPAMRNLADRIRHRCVLFPLPYDEAEDYLAYLLRQRGGSQDQVLGPSCRRAVLQAAGGNLKELKLQLGMRLAAGQPASATRQRRVTGRGVLRSLAGAISVAVMAGGIIGIAAPDLVHQVSSPVPKIASLSKPLPAPVSKVVPPASERIRP